MRVLFVCGSPRAESRSRRLVHHARDHAARTHDVDTDLLDLREEAPAPFRGFDEDYPEETYALLDRLERADAFILGSPVFNGSHSGALKNLFEHVDYKALQGRVAGFILVSGGQISFLQARSHLEQLMTYFRVRTVPRSVFATRDQVDDGPPQKILERVEGLVDEAVRTRRALVDAGVAKPAAPEAGAR